MERVFRIVIALAALLLIVAIVYYFYIYYQHNATNETNYVITKEDAQTGIFYVIALDIDGDNQVSPKSVAEGKDAILMVKPTAKIIPIINKPGPKPDYYVFNGARTLHELDHNFDSAIKQDDPVYEDLVLATMNGQKKINAVPLSNSGIDNIFFNRDYLALIHQGKDAPAYMTIGYVTDRRGTNRILKIIPLPVRLFQ